jgi:hypothetical protein
MATGQALAVIVRIVVTKTADGKTAIGEWHSGFTCSASATQVASGVQTLLFQDEIGLSSTCVDFSVSGQIVRPRFTGLAGTALVTRMTAKYWIN